jgi:hypothetical protein
MPDGTEATDTSAGEAETADDDGTGEPMYDDDETARADATPAARTPLQAEGFVITAQHIRVATEVLQKAGRLRVSSRRGTGGGRHLDPRTSAELSRRLGSPFEVFEDDMDEGEILEKNERLDMVIVRARQEAQL